MNNNNISNLGERENDLINRYVYAVTRRLPLSMRKDVDKELHSIISDTLDARCGDAAPTEQDVKVVLTELGTPSELSAKYDPNGERYLISPKYFPSYYLVLKICLACVLFGMLLSGAINLFMDPPQIQSFTGFWLLVSKALGTLVASVISVFGAVTLLFAFFEYKKVSLDGSEDISRLPAVPADNARIKKSECIVGIAFSVIFLLMMCFVPQIIKMVAINDAGVEQSIPMFNTALVRSMWPVWVAFFVLGAGRELVKMFVGVYNVPVLIVTAVCDVLSAVLAAIAFLPRNIMNPDLLPFIQNITVGNADAEKVLSVISVSFNRVFFAILVFALALDLITTAVKTVKYSASEK